LHYFFVVAVGLAGGLALVNARVSYTVRQRSSWKLSLSALLGCIGCLLMGIYRVSMARSQSEI